MNLTARVPLDISRPIGSFYTLEFCAEALANLSPSLDSNELILSEIVKQLRQLRDAELRAADMAFADEIDKAAAN